MGKNRKVPGADMQKDPNRTAGSILNKLRGPNIKTRALIEILLNTSGVRVDFRKTQGVFNKSARRTVMFRSDPLILDPTAQIG